MRTVLVLLISLMALSASPAAQAQPSPVPGWQTCEAVRGPITVEQAGDPMEFVAAVEARVDCVVAREVVGRYLEQDLRSAVVAGWQCWYGREFVVVCSRDTGELCEDPAVCSVADPVIRAYARRQDAVLGTKACPGAVRGGFWRELSATNVTCSAARSVMRRYVRSSGAVPRRGRIRVGRWRCDLTILQGADDPYGRVRCVARHGRRVRFYGIS